jgi:hypothetical protein
MQRITRVTACGLTLALLGAFSAGCAHHQPTTRQVRLQEQKRPQAEEQKLERQRLAQHEKMEKKEAEMLRREQARADAEAAKREQEREKNFMPDERDMHTVDEFVMASAAAGAREDAMLFESHFDGERLNSAGKAKLFLMLENRAEAPIDIYVDLPANDPLANQRMHAVKDYLAKTGLGGSGVQVKEGDNPAVRTAAARGLLDYHKTDTGLEVSGEQGGYQPVATPASMAPAAR